MEVEITDGTIVEPSYFRLVGDDTIYVNDTTIHTYTVEVDPNASNFYKEYRFAAYDINDEQSDDLILDIGWANGKLTIKGYGEGYIYAVAGNWLVYDRIKVEVKNILPDFELSDKRIVIGEAYKVLIEPNNSDLITYDKYTYSSSDEVIATIDGLGNITPKKAGKTTIKVVVDDGFDKVEKEFILTVDNKVIEDDIGSSFGKIIRKGIAHFLGFIVFGFISFFMFYLFLKTNYEGNKKYIYLLIGINGLVFAILTESIQLVSPGRDGTIRDVLLDYFGYTISFIISITIIVLCYLINKHKNNTKNILDISE
jgi:VanZ family protein